jgi:hypothetical protein
MAELALKFIPQNKMSGDQEIRMGWENSSQDFGSKLNLTDIAAPLILGRAITETYVGIKWMNL